MTEPDYAELEQHLRAYPAATGPAILCQECSAAVPDAFTFGKKIYHPHGRNEHKT